MKQLFVGVAAFFGLGVMTCAASDLQCEKSANGSSIATIAAYPSDVTWELTVRNVDSNNPSTALFVSDPLLETLGFSFTPAPPVTLGVDRSVTADFTMTIDSFEACVALADAAPGTTTSVNVDNVATVTWDTGSSECTARVTCVPPTTSSTFTGFFAPIGNPPILNTVKAGSAIPVKFSLGGDFGLNILAPGFPTSQLVACNNTAPADSIEGTLTVGAAGLTYDPTSGQYAYLWKTNRSWAGTCRQLNVTLNDGSAHLIDFRFAR